MSTLRLILLSLAHHWRLNAAVGLGVTAATAVLTGALLVGDSVRGSLRHLTLDRLGRIDQVLVTNRFFRQELAEELARSPEFQGHFSAAVPMILLQGSVENAMGERQARAGQVTILGCDDRFWQLGTVASAGRPGRRRSDPQRAAGRGCGTRGQPRSATRSCCVSREPARCRRRARWDARRRRSKAAG